MKPFQKTVAVGTLSVLAAISAGAQVPASTTVEIKTPLNLLGPDGTFFVMANETRTAAADTNITVVFHDARDVVLKTVTGVYRAGQPAIFSLRRAEVPGTARFAKFWAEVRVSRPGNFSPSAAAISFKLVDGTGGSGCGGACHSCPEEIDGQDVSCAQPENGRKPEFSCPDGSAYIDRITVVP